jgi:hypothetical protein
MLTGLDVILVGPTAIAGCFAKSAPVLGLIFPFILPLLAQLLQFQGHGLPLFRQ